MAETDTYYRLRGRYAAFLAGTITVDDLDDEELAQGRLKAIDGTFRGRPPLVIPAEMVNAMRREWLGRAEAKLREALMTGGIGTMAELSRDTSIDPAVRLRAADMVVQRCMGKVPDKIVLAADDPVEALFRSILKDPAGLDPAKETEDKTTLEMIL